MTHQHFFRRKVRNSIIISVVLFSALIFASEQDDFWGPESIPPSIRKDSAEKIDTFITKYQNGNIRDMQFFQNSKPVGIWKHFNMRGNLTYKTIYKNGEPLRSTDLLIDSGRAALNSPEISNNEIFRSLSNYHLIWGYLGLTISTIGYVAIFSTLNRGWNSSHTISLVSCSFVFAHSVHEIHAASMLKKYKGLDNKH